MHEIPVTSLAAATYKASALELAYDFPDFWRHIQYLNARGT
jgi:hypothetical protein